MRAVQRSSLLPSSTAQLGRQRFPLELGATGLALAQMLHSHFLVSTWSSLRCQVCRTGHSLDIFQRSFSLPAPNTHTPPSPQSDFSVPAFSQQLKGRCINPSKGLETWEECQGPSTGAKKILLAGFCQSQCLAPGNTHASGSHLDSFPGNGVYPGLARISGCEGSMIRNKTQGGS